MPKFAWYNGEETGIITAPNEEAAYELTLKWRIEAGNTREEAEAWASKHDRLEEITFELS